MPNWPGESGVLDGNVPDDLRQLALRDSIWLSLVSGGAGYMQWPIKRQPVGQLGEYRLAAEFLAGEDWLAGDLASPRVTIDIRELARLFETLEDRDAKLASPLFDSLRRYEKLSLDRGIAIALRLGEAGIDGGQFDEDAMDGITPWLSVPAGYQMRCIAAQDLSAGIAYLRNWEPEAFGPYALRRGADRPFGLDTNLPEGRYRFEVLDLGRGKSEVTECLSPGPVLQPRETTADFAVKFRRL